jgi:cell wall-associated NlpC family hydrolase
MAEKALDPRTHAARPDLADARLEGRVAATRYVLPMPAACHASATPLLHAPDDGAMQVSELLWGEAVDVFESRDGWAWVQALHDRYVGYVAAAALGPRFKQTLTHRVIAPASHLYPEPSVKARPIRPLFAATQLAIDETLRQGGFVAVAGGGWIAAEHVRPLGQPMEDGTSMAERLLGAPYLWGGRTVRGLDCSGLVQIALAGAGIAAPRDSDQQAALGADLGADLSVLKRGDLVFFPGHVGLMVDESHIIHANVTHMAVTIDPLAQVISWVRRRHEAPVTALKRLAPSA